MMSSFVVVVVVVVGELDILSPFLIFILGRSNLSFICLFESPLVPNKPSLGNFPQVLTKTQQIEFLFSKII
jgi:hypothetical protein